MQSTQVQQQPVQMTIDNLYQIIGEQTVMIKIEQSKNIQLSQQLKAAQDRVVELEGKIKELTVVKVNEPETKE